MLKRPSSTRSRNIRCRRSSAAGWSQCAQDADNLGTHTMRYFIPVVALLLDPGAVLLLLAATSRRLG